MNVETIKFLIKIDYLEKKLIGEDKKIFVKLFYLFNECVRMLEEKEQQCKKQKEVIDRAIRTLEIQIEIIKEQPSDNDVNDNFEIRQREMIINLLKGVENE